MDSEINLRNFIESSFFMRSYNNHNYGRGMSSVSTEIQVLTCSKDFMLTRRMNQEGRLFPKNVLFKLEDDAEGQKEEKGIFDRYRFNVNNTMR